jgi:POT family proton-dependent oligopeptide transporter
LVALGTGLLKPNVSAMPGTLYLVQATEDASDTAYFGGLAIVTIVVAFAVYALAPWIRRHTDVRQTS